MGGHYTAYIRPLPDQAWYYADDNCVQPVRDRDWLETEWSEIDNIEIWEWYVIWRSNYFHSFVSGQMDGRAIHI